MASKLKIKKGDNVVVITGRDKGKSGTVLRVMPKDSRVLVQGIHVAKRHSRPAAGQAGGIIEKELSIHVSNVALVDPKTSKPTRVGFKVVNGDRKVRVARRSGEVIDI